MMIDHPEGFTAAGTDWITACVMIQITQKLKTANKDHQIHFTYQMKRQHPHLDGEAITFLQGNEEFRVIHRI